MKSKGCLLTYWLPMASIVFNSARIYNSQFKCKYLKNGKIFQGFFFHFWNPHQISNILKKKMMVLANVFSKLWAVKNFVTPLCKKRRFEMRLDSPHVKVSRVLAKSRPECFHQVFFINFREIDLENISLSVLWNLRGVC